MDNREKMLKGLMYDPFQDGLCEDRTKAHALCQQYNLLRDDQLEEKNKILDELIPNRKEGVYIQGPLYVDYGKYIIIGKNSYMNFNFTALDCSLITIGDNVFIGPNVTLATPVHPLRYQERNIFFNEETKQYTDLEYSKPITIKDNCWIASNVTIIGGVTIGEGCVIGAGSVVTRDIPPHSLAFGNPARVIRKITEEDTVYKK